VDRNFEPASPDQRATSRADVCIAMPVEGRLSAHVADPSRRGSCQDPPVRTRLSLAKPSSLAEGPPMMRYRLWSARWIIVAPLLAVSLRAARTHRTAARRPCRLQALRVRPLPRAALRTA
jgi:hypothetical protein